ncbi:MAG: flagellar basal-body MS-ring/collar protein FliF [Desulfatiglandaceae bacterium]
MPFSELIAQIKALLMNISPAKRMTLLTLSAGTILGFVFLMLWTGRPDFQLLYTNLESEDAGAILAELKDQKVPYEIASNGRSILIPSERIYETRLELASRGLPQGSGVGFEIFDNTKLGMTEFVQNVNYQRATQGELSRTINGFAEVESSRVHIVMPPKSLFIEEEKPATASVVLKLRRGKRLNTDQVQGIVHLVSSSVSGLNPDNVTVVDNNGRMLAGFKPGSAVGQVSSDQLEFQAKLEKNYQDRIRTMLETALGPGKAIVRVSCSMDFKRQEKTEETYQTDNKVVRSEQLFNETSNGGTTSPMGVPGVVSNLAEGGKQPTTTVQAPSFQKQDRTVNYEIGKVTSHTIEPVGRLGRISVAVIVDGSYRSAAGTTGAERWEYFPRTPEEMAKFEGIVKRAVNFDVKRGDEIEVVNIPFETARLTLAENQEEIAEGGWLSTLKRYGSVAKYGFLALFVLLSFAFVVRPLVQWLTSGSIENGDILNRLPKTVGELEREYGEGMKSLPFKNKALQMITADKEGSVELLRNWLKES